MNMPTHEMSFSNYRVSFDTNSEESVDYPDFAHKLANEISTKNLSGVLICGSGVGMSMVANRYKKVRAALCFNENMANIINYLIKRIGIRVHINIMF